jgi:hypothetical protein
MDGIVLVGGPGAEKQTCTIDIHDFQERYKDCRSFA